MKTWLMFVFLILSVNVSFAMDNSYDIDKKLSMYSTIIVNNFETKDIIISLMDEDEMNKFKPMLPKMAQDITYEIVSRLKINTKFKNIVMNNKEIEKNAIRIEGKIDEFNGGHGAAKWVLGFMAPKSVKTYLAYSGKLVDVETGKVIATFSDTNTGAVWFKDSISYSNDMMIDIAEDVADFIEDNYY
ncbi:MAG: DUF4410 domain-containing protein [Geobacter sp.]